MYSKAQIIAARKAVNFEVPSWAGIAPPGWRFFCLSIY